MIVTLHTGFSHAARLGSLPPALPVPVEKGSTSRRTLLTPARLSPTSFPCHRE